MSLLLELPAPTVHGRIARVVGAELEVRGLRVRVGDTLDVHTRDGVRPAEVISLTTEGARALLYGETTGIARGDLVAHRGGGVEAIVGPDLIGRVVDALGRPMDGGPPITGMRVPVDQAAPDPMTRQRIREPLPVGVRVIDSLCTVGRGQRVGIFAGSGVGKSTLLGMLARGTQADVNVVALIGERGREVREFLEDDLGPEGLARSIVVVATSEQPALIRLRAGFLATRIAEHFADDGADVLLMLDSLTRLAMAQREVGLAAGEPPTARGYTPSVFSLLPKLLERAGPREVGTVTAMYTVLTEGSDLDDDPVADAARGILDGHIILDRSLLTAGRVPAIDPLISLSRLATKVRTHEQDVVAARVRALLAAAEQVRDLVEVGAYVRGTNQDADLGLDLTPAILDVLTQQREDISGYEDTWNALAVILAQGGAM